MLKQLSTYIFLDFNHDAIVWLITMVTDINDNLF